MAQIRNLQPVMTYLPPAAIAEAQRRAKAKTLPLATLLRLILLGEEPPLRM